MSNYTDDELMNLIQDDEELKALLQEWGAYGNKNTGPKEIRYLLKWKNEYGLSFDLIECLFEFCAQIMRMDSAFLDKIAQNWSSRGFQTRKDAEAFSDEYYANIRRKRMLSDERIIEEFSRLTNEDKELVFKIITRLAERR